MNKFSMRKYKKEYLKAKKMLGIKNVKGSHVILGLVAVGVIYFVFIKGKGLGGFGAPKAVGVMPGGEVGTYIVPPHEESVTNTIGSDELGTLPGFLQQKPVPYDIYSGAVGDIQYMPSAAEVPYQKDGVPPYEYGWTYAPF